MATMTEVAATVYRKTPYHDYHATASVLRGRLERPIEQEIEEQAALKLEDRRGGHLTRFSEEVSIEGLITFTKGKTRVSGSRSRKNNGWITLSTSIIEGLNALEVITADRVVSQVSTEHPHDDGHFPQVTFLGTQFTNLAVSGFPLQLTFNFGICGNRPAENRSYLRDVTFLNAVKQQTQKIANAAGLPTELKTVYLDKITAIDELIRSKGDNEPSRPHEPKVTCSLIESIGKVPIPGVTSYGNLLVIPDFGTVTLGEIVVGEKNYEDSTKPGVYFELTGINMQMGCVGDGNAQAANAKANGTTRP